MRYNSLLNFLIKDNINKRKNDEAKKIKKLEKENEELKVRKLSLLILSLFL